MRHRLARQLKACLQLCPVEAAGDGEQEAGCGLALDQQAALATVTASPLRMPIRVERAAATCILHFRRLHL